MIGYCSEAISLDIHLLHQIFPMRAVAPNDAGRQNAMDQLHFGVGTMPAAPQSLRTYRAGGWIPCMDAHGVINIREMYDSTFLSLYIHALGAASYHPSYDDLGN